MLLFFFKAKNVVNDPLFIVQKVMWVYKLTELGLPIYIFYGSVADVYKSRC